MCARGNRELERERGICPVDEIEEPEENEECCTELPHEVRHVKDVQHLECPDPDREIRDEDTGVGDIPDEPRGAGCVLQNDDRGERYKHDARPNECLAHS